LGKLPLPVLRAVASRPSLGRLAQVFAQRLWVDGFYSRWVVMGSRLACPRSQELEERLVLGKNRKRKRKKEDRTPPLPRARRLVPRACPQLWVTAVVHLGLGVLWSWRLGTGHANEREQLAPVGGHLAARHPAGGRRRFLSATICWAGLQAAGLSFLVRLSSRAPLYVPDKSTLKKYREGRGLLTGPRRCSNKTGLRCRSACGEFRADKGDVYLMTNVLDEQRLPRRTAAKFYRWRWRNEGLFSDVQADPWAR